MPYNDPTPKWERNRHWGPLVVQVCWYCPLTTGKIRRRLTIFWSWTGLPWVLTIRLPIWKWSDL